MVLNMDMTIVDWFGYNLPPQERMRLIKEAGFTGIIGVMWTDQFDNDYKSFPEYARNAGLNIENMHGLWVGTNELWTDSLAGQAFMGVVLENIKSVRFLKFQHWLCTPNVKTELNMSNSPKPLELE